MTSNEGRPTREETYLEIARVIARRGTCKRLSVGCVITQENRIVGMGYNGPPKGTRHCDNEICDLDEGCTRAIHAESNAIAFAAKYGISLSGSILYTTHQPCIKCSELIIQSGIISVIYSEPYRIIDGIRLLEEAKVCVKQSKF